VRERGQSCLVRCVVAQARVHRSHSRQGVETRISTTVTASASPKTKTPPPLGYKPVALTGAEHSALHHQDPLVLDLLQSFCSLSDPHYPQWPPKTGRWRYFRSPARCATSNPYLPAPLSLVSLGRTLFVRPIALIAKNEVAGSTDRSRLPELRR
jgi:hypothetical protein